METLQTWSLISFAAFVSWFIFFFSALDAAFRKIVPTMSRLRVWAPNWREPACDTVGRRNKLATVAVNKATRLRTPPCCVVPFPTNATGLCEPANADCYLPFHVDGRRPAWGQLIDLPCVFASDSGSRCQCLTNSFFRSALLTLPLNFEDPEAAVIFSKSICLIAVSQMEVNNLSSALRTGLYMSPVWSGKILGGFAEMNRARSFCWWQAWFYY